MYQIIDGIYESARQPSGWDAVLERIAVYLEATSAVLLYRNYRFGKADLSVGGGGAIWGPVAEVCQIAEPELKRLPSPYTAVGKLAPLPETAVVQQEGYRQLGIAHVARGWMFRSEEHGALLEVHRPRNAAPFAPALLEQLTPLSEHLERAFRLHALCVKEELRQRGLADSIEHLAVGVVMFNRSGKVVYRNSLAERLIENHPEVELHSQKLVVSDPAQAEQLRQSVAVATFCQDPGEESFSVFSLGSHEGRTLRCWLMPLENPDIHSGENLKDAQAVLYISDPARTSPLDRERLIALFDLTAKEAEVAAAIAEGESVEAIAERHHRSVNTVRTQLKEVFRKTGVQRQSELVRLILDGTHLVFRATRTFRG